MAEKMVITVGRQFGSGGREVARKVAEMLGISFYDKELIALAAKESGLSEELFEGIEDMSSNSLLYSLVMGIQSGNGSYYRYGDVFNSDGLFRVQSQVIRGLAEKGSCVVVGRCADYILREQPNLMNVFVHAEQDCRIKRVAELHNLSEKEAAATIKKTDKRRGSFYNFYTSQTWGNVNNYHLAVNTSKLGIEGAAQLIVDATKIMK